MVLITVACVETELRPSPTEATAPPTTLPGSTTTTQVALEAVTAYETCLAESGVGVEPIPYDATGRPRLELVMRDVDFTDAETVDALTRCAPNLSSGALDLTDSPVLRERVNQLLSEFSDCVRDHGVDSFPDPVPDFSGVGGPYPLAEIPYDDADLGDAIAVCKERLG